MLNVEMDSYSAMKKIRNELYSFNSTYTRYDIPYPATPISMRVTNTDIKGKICSFVRLSDM